MGNDYRYLTPPAAARRLGVSPDRVLRWIADGALRAKNVGNRSAPRWQIDPDDVRAFQERRTNESRLIRHRRRSRAFAITPGV